MTAQKLHIVSADIVSRGSELIVGFSDGTVVVFPGHELLRLAPERDLLIAVDPSAGRQLKPSS